MKILLGFLIIYLSAFIICVFASDFHKKMPGDFTLTYFKPGYEISIKGRKIWVKTERGWFITDFISTDENGVYFYNFELY